MEADRHLSKLQTLALDAAGPLVVALEEMIKEDSWNIFNSIQQALLFLGNALLLFTKKTKFRREDFAITVFLSSYDKFLKFGSYLCRSIEQEQNMTAHSCHQTHANFYKQVVLLVD